METTACLTQCGGECTDPTSDTQHCGSCNVKCDAGVSCDSGICGRSLYRGPGSYSVCATKPNGALYCWGNNDKLEAGLGVASSPFGTPTQATNLGASHVGYAATTGAATCVFLPPDAVSCFGYNKGGAVGNGTLTGTDAPCADPGNCIPDPYPTISSGVAELAGGGNWTGGAHLCARMKSGHVTCWGQLDTDIVASHPTEVPGLDEARAITSGAGFTCAIRADGSLWCAGTNDYGQLGQGNTNGYPIAQKVPGLVNVTAIGAGVYHVCARSGDDLYCWGNNRYGEIGVNSMETVVASPTKVVATPGLEDVVQISGAIDSTCALTAKGDVFCWGVSNGGLLGTGQNAYGLCPQGGNYCTLVPTDKVQLNGASAVEIALGAWTAMARLKDGSLVSWGANASGELGIGTVGGGTATPVAVLNFP